MTCTCCGMYPHESFCGKDFEDYQPQHIWTVQARRSGEQWSVWSEWVDYSTAVDEQVVAQREGFMARIVRATYDPATPTERTPTA